MPCFGSLENQSPLDTLVSPCWHSLKMLSSGADMLLREKATVWHEHGQQILAQSHHTKIEVTENEENLFSYQNLLISSES